MNLARLLYGVSDVDLGRSVLLILAHRSNHRSRCYMPLCLVLHPGSIFCRHTSAKTIVMVSSCMKLSVSSTANGVVVFSPFIVKVSFIISPRACSTPLRVVFPVFSPIPFSIVGMHDEIEDIEELVYKEKVALAKRSRKEQSR